MKAESSDGEEVVRLYFVLDTFITVPSRVFQPDLLTIQD
jgi:hypothetical protein